jgi:hypothetical protein
MRAVPLFSERSRLVQVLTAVVAPAAIGALAGLALGWSAGLYYLVGLIAAIGGVLAGLEHRDGWGGADRGLAGGALYGTFLLLAHAATGKHAKVALPHIEPILAVFTAIIGMFLGALGGRLRRVVVKQPAPAKGSPTSGSPV